VLVKEHVIKLKFVLKFWNNIDPPFYYELVLEKIDPPCFIKFHKITKILLFELLNPIEPPLF
jgi:hypothetical protein